MREETPTHTNTSAYWALAPQRDRLAPETKNLCLLLFGSNKTIYRPKRFLNLNKIIKEVHLQHACGQSSQQKTALFNSHMFYSNKRLHELHRPALNVIKENRTSRVLLSNIGNTIVPNSKHK